MANEQPSCNCWFSSQQSVYMASNVKKKCKNGLHIIKKHLGRSNFLLFLNFFHRFREHPIVSKLKQIHATKYMQACVSYSVSFSYISIFFYVSKSNVKFCHKNFPLPIVSHYHWTRNLKSVTDEI